MTYDAAKNSKASYDLAIAEMRRRHEAKDIPAKRVEFITPTSEPTDITYSGFERMVTVYGIRRDGQFVYVGSTNQAIHLRIRAHVANAKKGSLLPIHDWMRGCGFRFEVVHLDTVSELDRSATEQGWVSRLGVGLLNLTDGGAGLSGFKFAGSEHAKRIAEAIRTGSYFDCETCGKSFWRKRTEIIKGHSRFCSRPCYQSWQRGKPKPARQGAR